MNAKLQKLLAELREAFWLVPAAMVVGGVLLAVALLQIDRTDAAPSWLSESGWLYNGGGTGARTLLGAIASSTIGVAGTVFSITIAALSLAAGQMGPRLLRNFTRDRGNQVTLGAFLGTYSYALMVLRSVRTQDEALFTPHLALTMGLVLAFACVGTLVYFVGHMAGRINVDTVVDLVSEDIRLAMRSLVTAVPSAPIPSPSFWRDSISVVDGRRGYLQHLYEDGLADWAAEHGTSIRLLVRCGDYVFPGAPIALMTVQVPGVEEAIRNNSALGASRGSSGDVDHAIRQLVEVAVRALSPGINDPHTAVSVLDRLGATLCDLAGAHLPSGVQTRQDRTVLVVPAASYESLSGAMFHMIRQNAAGNTVVLIRILHVLMVVASCESDPDRRTVLAAHAELVKEDAHRDIANASDLSDVMDRHAAFCRTMVSGPLGAIGALGVASDFAAERT